MNEERTKTIEQFNQDIETIVSVSRASGITYNSFSETFYITVSLPRINPDTGISYNVRKEMKISLSEMQTLAVLFHYLCHNLVITS